MRSSRSRADSGGSTQVVRDAARGTKSIAKIHKLCAIYTHPEVAEAILDRVQWVPTANLGERRLLEPACGDGSFVLPAIRRLLQWAKRRSQLSIEALQNSIVAFEFDAETSLALRTRVTELLQNAGLSISGSMFLANRWVRCEDFLLAKNLGLFSDVVGNPPYLRWSKVPAGLRRNYSSALPPHSVKGDLCLAFIWKSSEHLVAQGSRIAFLCADRWLRCAYGRGAREELAKRLRLTVHIDVHAVPVFAEAKKIGAYPAISILEPVSGGRAVVGYARNVPDLKRRLDTSIGPSAGASWSSLRGNGSAWLADSTLLRAFQGLFQTAVELKSAGVNVRCGLALGCSDLYVTTSQIEIEAELLVPWTRSRDLYDAPNTLSSARFINVWTKTGELVALSDYPLLAKHLRAHKQRLMRRACVIDESDWYRTIDKPDISRIRAPKLFVAGMATRSIVAMSPGGTQHSNSIYAISSNEWPLQALFYLLAGGLLNIFAAVLSPRFAGNALRFDGNVLRQVRIPRWTSVPSSLKRELVEAGATHFLDDPGWIFDLYGIHGLSHRRRLAQAIRMLR